MFVIKVGIFFLKWSWGTNWALLFLHPTPISGSHSRDFLYVHSRKKACKNCIRLVVAKVAHAYFVSRKRLASMCIAKMVNHVMKTNALSFHKSQNVLGWSKFFVPDQKFI